MNAWRRQAAVLWGVMAWPLAACHSADYLRSRLYDTADMMPISVGAGPLLYVGARVTVFLGSGLGYAATERVGWCRRAPDAAHGDLEPRLQWREEELGVLLAWMRTDDPLPGAANLFLVYPDRGGFLALFRKRLPNDLFDWGSLLDVEAELHLAVGIRAAISPVQALDWLVGWVGLDLLGDDVVTPEPEPETRSDRE
ncbi:MAG: hypothetical protein U1E76_12950 [Planctomycetota bacterium]